MTDIQIEQEPRTMPQPQNKVRAALVKAWGSFPSVIKDRDNQITRSRYATLDSLIETIKPILSENELMPSQEIETSTRTVTVRTMLYHSSGECIEFSPVQLPVVGKRISGGGGEYSDNNGPQEFGSSITYARRYALLAALGISTGDDDDGNAGQQHRSAHTKPTPPKKGSTLKGQIKEAAGETLGEDAAQKLIDYARGFDLTIDDIREYLASLGSNHAKVCEQPPEKWPAGWRSTIKKFLTERKAAVGGDIPGNTKEETK